MLVALGVIGLLTALVLPSIRSSREAARRQQCADHLRQIGIALNAHQSTHGYYPRGGYVGDVGEGSVVRFHAPHVYLLPYLDRTPLYARIDFAAPADRSSTHARAINADAITTAIPLFRCPSDPGTLADARNNYRASVGITAVHYGYDQIVFPPQRAAAHGAFTPSIRYLRPQDFIDGMSNTVGFSEKLVGDGSNDYYSPGSEYFYVSDYEAIVDSPDITEAFIHACSSLSNPDPPHDSTVGLYWFFAGYADTLYNHVLTPNSSVPDCGTQGSTFVSGGVFSARSAHPGGVNCLLMDGSVRFVNNSIDTSAWRAVGTRDGSEPGSF